MKKLICFVFMVLLFSACGGGSESDGDGATDVAAEPVVIEIIGDDFSFELPEAVPAGPMEIRLQNAGTEPHQALIYRLNDGIDYREYVKAALKDDSAFPAMSVRVGGVNYGVPAGETEVYEGSDPYEAGTYAVVCFIKETESGENHYELGMIAPLTVE